MEGLKKLTVHKLMVFALSFLVVASFGMQPIYAQQIKVETSGLTTAPHLTEIGTSTSGGLGVKWTGDSYFMGKLGVGVTNPDALLHIQNGSINYSWTPNARTLVIMEGTDHNAAVLSLIAVTDTEIWFGNADFQEIGRIRYEQINKVMEFWVDRIERAKIDANGNVSVGTESTTSKLAVNGGRVTIDVDGTFTEGDHHLEISNGAAYSELDAGEAQFTTSSTRKIKENIKPVKNKINLAMMDSVKAVEFNFRFDKIVQQFDPKKIANWDSMTIAQQDKIRFAWIKKEAIRAQKEANRKHVGLIAEDFGKILGRKNAEKINWNEVTIVMWEAIRDLRKRVAMLEKEVAELKQSK